MSGLQDNAPQRVGAAMLVLVIGVLWLGLGALQRVHEDDLANSRVVALPEMRVDINTASEAELTLLPGIGQRLAERVVNDRESLGRFTSLSDLARVTWIGPVIVERIGPIAFVSEPEQ